MVSVSYVLNGGSAGVLASLAGELFGTTSACRSRKLASSSPNGATSGVVSRKRNESPLGIAVITWSKSSGDEKDGSRRNRELISAGCAVIPTDFSRAANRVCLSLQSP